MNPAEFIEAVWTHQPPGWVQTWQAATRASSYHDTPSSAAGCAGRPDTYVAVATAPAPLPAGKRCKAADVHAIAGMWLDIDINGGPEHRTGRAPNWDAALQIASAVADPTIIVNSGWGMQAWWLLDAPWILDTSEQRTAAAVLARQWQRGHAELFRDKGWGIDAAHDLARLLRLPGTINAKGGDQRMVTVEHHDLTVRYSRRELHDLVGHVDGSDYQTRASSDLDGGRPRAAGPVVVTGQLGDDARRLLDAVLDVDPMIRATWYRECKPPGDGSPSSWDLSLASRIAALQQDVPDQVLAEIVAEFRRRGGDPKGKAGRGDYLERTVLLAKRQGAHDALAAEASSLAADGRQAALRRAGLA